MPERMMWVNGRLCRGTEAALSLRDRGARDGEGLFETLRVYSGRPFQWELHLERLVLSAAELGFPVPPSPAALEGALEELLGAVELSDAVARITVTRGEPGGRPTRAGCWIEVEPLETRLWRGARTGAGAGGGAGTGGGAIAVFSRRAFIPGSLARHKTTSRLAFHLARDEARARRADEALLVSPEGQVLEGSVSNVFAVGEGGEIRTPPLEAGVLPGITRAWVLAACAKLALPAREHPITREWLEGAREVFLTNSVQQIVPVRKLEDRTVPEQAIGLRLSEAYRAILGS